MPDCYDVYLWTIGALRLSPEKERLVIFEMNQWRKSYE